MTAQNLLVELFVEELPPKALKKLGESFAELLSGSLKAQGLAASDATISAYATPRRLAVWVEKVAAQAADKPVSQKLMPVGVALDANGNATPALLKRLAALGADASVMPQLKREGEGKSETLYFDSVATGVTLAEGLQKALDETLTKLPIPKVMQYQLADGWSSVHFVRPAHGLVALHGASVVSIFALGLQAGRETCGHRFEAQTDIISVKNADSYAAQLRDEGAVIASFAERRADIVRQLNEAAAKEGGQPIEDDALLDEVCGLVELPTVMTCQFEPEFLQVPQECLILTMKANQKYFPLLDAGGKLTNKFLIVSNIRPDDASAVIQGNERVVRPRLADAKFFFDQDRKRTLESRVPGLSKVVYHNKLGTQGERLVRVQWIAVNIASTLGGIDLPKTSIAAKLAKADLLTDMVGEFPELQGIMGRYYALHDQLDKEVAFVIEDHYKPRFAGDELPRSDVGLCVALADKLATLFDLFGIGEKPSGDKDPFALRRHTLGVIRILVERKLNISLVNLLQVAENSWLRGAASQRQNTLLVTTIPTLLDFFYDRFSGFLRDQDYLANEIEAVLVLRPAVLADIPKRLEAVRAFAGLPEAPALAAANKRVGNILKKVEGAVPVEIDPARFVEAAEKALYDALTQIKPRADAAFDSGDYTASLQALAALKAPVDAFFDGVMVNADNPALKANRLALLNQLRQTMNRVADLSKLAA